MKADSKDKKMFLIVALLFFGVITTSVVQAQYYVKRYPDKTVKQTPQASPLTPSYPMPVARPQSQRQAVPKTQKSFVQLPPSLSSLKAENSYSQAIEETLPLCSEKQMQAASKFMDSVDDFSGSAQEFEISREKRKEFKKIQDILENEKKSKIVMGIVTKCLMRQGMLKQIK